jgi:hypothetical protein
MRNTSGLKRGGSPGRKPGVPNRATIEVKEAARAFLADPDGQARLLEQYRRGKLHPSVLALFYHYAFGKPKDELELTGANGEPVSYRFIVSKASDRV